MPNSAGSFFGEMLNGIGDKFVEKKKTEHAEQQDAIKRTFEAGTMLFDKGFEDIGAALIGHTLSNELGVKGKDGKPGKPSNPIQAFLSDPMAIGGLLKGLHKGLGAGKGKGKGDEKGSSGMDEPGTGGDQPESAAPTDQQPSEEGDKGGGSSPFRSREQNEAEGEARHRRDVTFQTDENIRAAKAEGRYKSKGSFTPGTTKGSDLPTDAEDTFGKKLDPGKSYKVRTFDDGTKEYIPVEGKQASDNSPQSRLARRIKTLNPDLSDDDAQKQAAQRLEDQDSLTQEQKTGRYNAFMRASNNAANLSSERLKEMQSMFPFHVAAAQAQADVAEFKNALQGQKTAQSAMKAIQSAQKMAEKIMSNRGIVTKVEGWFGYAPTQEDLVDGLLTEAGQDPAKVRELAGKAFDAAQMKIPKPVPSHAPTGATPVQPGGFKQDADGNWVISTDATPPQ